MENATTIRFIKGVTGSYAVYAEHKRVTGEVRVMALLRTSDRHEAYRYAQRVARTFDATLRVDEVVKRELSAVGD